jgi:inner membrane protein
MENNSSGFLQNKGVKLTLRLMLLGFIGLLMLIPLGLIDSVIKERERYRDEATGSISQAWGYSQIIKPVQITVPLKMQSNDNGKLTEYLEYVHFLPDELNIKANIQTETRSKGIFKKALYDSEISISGKFPILSINELLAGRTQSLKEVLWKNAFISVGISDVKGIQGQPKIDFANNIVAFQPGVKPETSLTSGIQAPLNLAEIKDKANSFSLKLNLKGTDFLNFLPDGKINKANIKSDWPNPSFEGSFLPTQKKVSDEGFEASWNISYLARNYPQSWISNNANAKPNQAEPNFGLQSQESKDNSFGVSLLIPVDFYRNCLRAVKYGILFVALTFITFFVFEVIARLKIHPFQYLLVGFAVALFYLLLLSLSEFVGFLAAYSIASFSTIALITLYTKAISKAEKPNLYLFMLGILTFLYSFLYLLLQLQDLSLLIGSIGLFIVLGIIMFATRKIQWYEQSNGI